MLRYLSCSCQLDRTVCFQRIKGIQSLGSFLLLLCAYESEFLEHKYDAGFLDDSAVHSFVNDIVFGLDLEEYPWIFFVIFGYNQADRVKENV